MTPLAIRQACREYALRFVAIQGEEFRRLGVFWDRRSTAGGAEGATRRAIYRTLDRTYEAEIVRRLGAFFSGGAVYHGEKPVHWCPVDVTALAEAEVEYEDRTDPSIYVRMPVHGAETRRPGLAGKKVAALIWTTTPSTMPQSRRRPPPRRDVRRGRGARRLDLPGGGRIWRRPEARWPSHEILDRFKGREFAEQPDRPGTVTYARPYPLQETAARPGIFVLGEHVTWTPAPDSSTPPPGMVRTTQHRKALRPGGVQPGR